MLTRATRPPVHKVQAGGDGGSRAFTLAAGLAGCEELLGGLQFWRVWHLLGVRELRHRYSRSKLGQAWLTVSSAIMIGALGIVWSLLWRQPVHELLPFIGISMVVWALLSQALTDCTSVFVNHGYLYRNQKMNFSISIYSVIYKNTLTLAQGLIIIVVLIAAFGVPVNWYLLQIVPALALTWITLTWGGYVTAMMCVRYRDIIQIINSWLAILFLVTPVMWKPDFFPARYHLLIDLNPLAQFLELLRNPLLGLPVSSYTWFSTAGIALGAGLFALPVIGRYRRRIILWM
jgi:ABC-type polysaccharide/polyol phosphate export permease